MPASDQSRWWIGAEATLATVLVALPWCLGGAPAWTLWVLVCGSSLALALWMVAGARNHRRWGWHPVLLVPLVPIAVALAQLVPLPPALLGALSRPAAELREFALVPLGLTEWRPATLDAPATARSLARFIALGALLFVALELGRQPDVRRRLSMVIALSGAAISLCGLGHLLASADGLFGVYHFYAPVPLLTPFGNTNHLAAYLLLTTTAALGLALDARARDAAIGWAVVALLGGVCVFLSYSRGGIATFVATWGLVGAAVLSRRGGGIRAVLPWVAIGATVTFAALLSFEQLVDRAATLGSIEKLRATKIDLWPMFARAAAPFWPLGMGLGAFELGFPRYQEQLLDVSFTHPENTVLQWLCEAGGPLTLVLTVVTLRAGYLAWRNVRGEALERTLLVALAGVLLHDCFDFALELNAVAPTAAVALGLVSGVGNGASRQAVRRGAIGFVGAGIVTALLAAAWGSSSHTAAELALREALEKGESVARVRAVAISGIDRHPADWVLYSNMAADSARRSDPRDALAWVNRVLYLRPLDSRSHAAAAQALLRLGKPLQALVELKSAWALGDLSTLRLGLSVAAREQAWDRVLLERRGHLTEIYRELRAHKQDADAKRVLEVAEAAGAEEVRNEASVLRVVHEVELGDPETALALYERLPAAELKRSEVANVKVEVLVRLKRDGEAVAELERLLARSPENLELAFRLVDLLVSQRQPARAHEVLARARPFAGSTSARSSVFQKEAALWFSEERWPRALEALQTASHIEPSRADLHYKLGEVYERMGSYHSALDEVRRGRALDSPESAKTRDEWVRRLEAAQQAVAP